MSGSAENQPKTATTSQERQPEPDPKPTPSPVVPPSAPAPAVGPYPGYTAQTPHWQQQQPYAPSPYGPQYPAGQQPVMVQPIRQQPAQANDTYCCCDSKTAVKVFATILLVLYSLGAIVTAILLISGSGTRSAYGNSYDTDYYYYNKYPYSKYSYSKYSYNVSCPVYSILALIMIADVVNAYCMQSSCWYFASSIVWGICAGIKVAALVVVTIITVIVFTYLSFFPDEMQSLLVIYCLAMIAALLADIALLIAYTVALCKASTVAKQQAQGSVLQSQPQYAPVPQPIQPQNPDQPQQYQV